MCGDQLVICLRKDQVADLRSCIDRINGLQAQRVPESDVLVSCASTCGEEAPMERTPIDCLDRS